MMSLLSATGLSPLILQNAQNLNISETLIHDQIPDKSRYEDMPDWGYATTAAVLFTIGFFGFFLNFFVIVLMCKDTQVSGKPI